jgi:hypothetical protein
MSERDLGQGEAIHRLALARTLVDLGARRVLIGAAIDGLIRVLECTMPACKCPGGRGYFERRSGSYERWAPSADRYPLVGRDGGSYDADNVRLAHYSCNVAAGPGLMQEIWGKSAEAHAIRSAAATKRNTTWGRTPEGRAAARLGGQRQPLEAKVRGAAIGRCSRYRIRQNKPCGCGYHAQEIA